MVSSNEKATIIIGRHEIANTTHEKLLGVHIDIGLSFDYIYQRLAKKQVVKFVR